MLCGFGADDEPLDSCFVSAGAATAWFTGVVFDGFGFAFGAADSLLTRTDAGTMAVSSGVCCARGLLTTVDAADLTYDGFCGAGSPAPGSSCGIGEGPGGSGGLIIGGGPKEGLAITGTITPGGAGCPTIPLPGNAGLISVGGGGGGNREIPGGKTSGCNGGAMAGPGSGGCCLRGGGGGGIIFDRS